MPGAGAPAAGSAWGSAFDRFPLIAAAFLFFMESTPLMKADASESAAPFLFSEAEIGAEKLEATGEFSGERLLARRPEVYRAICRMSAEGLSMSAMARALGVSRNTVAAVQDREQFPIEQQKKELLKNVRTAARLSVERVVELVPSINNAKDAAIVAAVMVGVMAGKLSIRAPRLMSKGEPLDIPGRQCRSIECW